MIFNRKERYELSRIIKALLFKQPNLVNFDPDAYKVVRIACFKKSFQSDIQEFIYVWNGLGLSTSDLRLDRVWANEHFQRALLRLLDKLDDLQGQILINESNLNQPSNVGESVPDWMLELEESNPLIKVRFK